MTQRNVQQNLSRRSLVVGLALLAWTQPSWAILGVWRRTARRAVVVGSAAAASTSAAAAASANAAASQEAAAAQSAQSAANASAAAAKQAQAAAAQATTAAAATKTPQQKLAELQSLYDQKLISQSDYQAAKAKILSQITQ